MRPESPNTVSRYPQFQSTHPHGVRLLCCGCLPGLYRISIHAPTRGATFRRLPGPLHLLISIHAPTRGATRRPHGCRAGPHQISIHAPTRGATMIGRQSISRGRDFNPRTHTGCDRGDAVIHVIRCISIHAPTRGATHPTVSNIEVDPISIHAPTRGATFGMDTRC